MNRTTELIELVLEMWEKAIMRTENIEELRWINKIMEETIKKIEEEKDENV